MKKRVAIMLVVIILINMIIPNFIYAIDEDALSGLGTIKDVVEEQQENGVNSAEELFEQGKAKVKPSNGKDRIEDPSQATNGSFGTFLINCICYVFTIPPKLVNMALTTIVVTTQDKEFSIISLVDDTITVFDKGFTIEDLVMGRYTLFDIDFFTDTNTSNTGVIDQIRINIAQWYFALRIIALVGGLLTLIYIGIRMAISSVASERAKYSQMLTSWAVSVVLIFVMQYIMIFLISGQSTIMNIIKPLVNSDTGFEETIIKDTYESIIEVTGWNKVPFLVLYYMLVYYQVKFFVMYFKRFLSVGFLIVISPLVTITYSIDKVGDGKAQAFTAWFREMIYNVFIQVIHAVIYVVFIYSAASIVKQVPMLGIVFLGTLSRAEKIVKNTFTLHGEGFGEVTPLKSFTKSISFFNN